MTASMSAIEGLAKSVQEYRREYEALVRLGTLANVTLFYHGHQSSSVDKKMLGEIRLFLVGRQAERCRLMLAELSEHVTIDEQLEEINHVITTSREPGHEG